MNYFEFFEIPVSFYLDETDLKKRFLSNSKKYHPDFFTLETEEKQTEVLELATLNNRAYRTLSNFDTRMEYILIQKGVLKGEGKNEIPQDFLMEMMDINEVLMDLEFDFNQTIFHQTEKNVERLEKGLFEEINPILISYPDDPEREEGLKKIKEFYLKKKYLWRIQENLNKFAAASQEA